MPEAQVTNEMAAPFQANGRLRLFIAGNWREGGDEAESAVCNPATTLATARFRHASHSDLAAALAAAEQAFAHWRKTPALTRSDILRDAARRLRGRAEAIAACITTEQGKVLSEARGEVTQAIETIEWYAEEARRIYGRVIPSRSDSSRMLVLREPVGPVAAFTPWNFPVLTPARKIAAALAAGCSCIIKPAEETPSACLHLAWALQEAGLPEGVLSVLLGSPDRISRALIASAVIRKVSFTGSTAVGKHLAALAADGAKRLTMELGGHAPVLVLGDVDAQATAVAAAQAKSRNAGQVCVSPTRFYVQRNSYERFVEAFAATATSLRLGNGLEAGTQMGPLANARRPAAFDRLVDNARSQGARVLQGGAPQQGWFRPLAVVADASEHLAGMNEEPFGPLALIAPFETLDHAIVQANRLPYGLAAYAFTNDARAMLRLSSELETGMLAFNAFKVSTPEAPFGGVKDSGYGSEGGSEGLEAYLSTKFVHQH